VVTGPGGQANPQSQTRFSADGFWWWDGAEWRPALSQDRLWRWNGQAWEPARMAPPASSGGAGLAVGITVAAFIGVLVLVALVTVVVLLTMGGQISNVFSNVVVALNGS
jgi:hypothetical protein